MASDVNITRQSGSDAISTISLAVAADDDGLAVAQAVGAAGNLTLAGALISGGAYAGTSYFSPPSNKSLYAARRMVVVSSDAGDTTQTATFTGTDRYGNAITDAVTLNGATPATTVLDFSTVTQIAMSALTAGNISAGTSARASGAWIEIDRVGNNPINIQMRTRLVSGAATWSVEETMYQPNGNMVDGIPMFPAETINGVQVGTKYPPEVFDDATITAKSASINGTISAPFWAYRLTVTAGTGTVQLIGLSAMKPWHR